MNKTIMFLGMLVVGFANAQQTNNYDGKVGVNTHQPTATLNVKSKTGTTSATKNLELENAGDKKLVTVLDNGQIGFNNSTPEYSFDINTISNSYTLGSMALRSYRDTGNGALDLIRYFGTKENPKTVVNGIGNGLMSIGILGYNGTKILNAARISTSLAGDPTADALPVNLDFRIYNPSKITGSNSVLPLSLGYNGNVKIGSQKNPIPRAALHLITDKDNATPEQLTNGKVDAMLIDWINLGTEHATTKERKTSISTTMSVYNDNNRAHSIDFGLIDISTAIRPFMAFSVAPLEWTPSSKNLDQTVEHMRIMHTGNIGMGTTAPTHKLHIVATENPLKLEGLQQAGAGAQNLVVEDGVVKIGTGNSATNIVTRDGAPTCSGADDAGKINFGEITLNGTKTEAFGFCMKNGTTGNYGWFYIHGAASTTTGSEGAFGNGL